MCMISVTNTNKKRKKKKLGNGKWSNILGAVVAVDYTALQDLMFDSITEVL